MNAPQALAACLADVQPARVTALAKSYTAWRVLSDRQSERMAVIAASLDAAVAEIAPRCRHKDHFIIAEQDALSGRTTAHFYTVKRKSAPRYVYRDHQTHRTNDLYAERLFGLAVNAFEPVEPWSWSPGADVVGRDEAIEGAAS